jgi:hypothetical protein
VTHAATSQVANDPTLDRTLRRVVIAIGVLLTCNNLLPYVGLRDESCQTMFSGLLLQPRTNNHIFVPQHSLSDIGTYWSDLHATVSPAPNPASDGAVLVAWLDTPQRYRNAEAVRSVVRRLCVAGHRVGLRATFADGTQVDAADACADSRLSRPHAWIPVRLFDPDGGPTPTTSATP